MTLHFDFPVWVAFCYLFVIGAVIGSFLNVCIYRIPTRLRFGDQLRALADRPSHCPRCKTRIAWYDNIPIFGWLKLRGRCRTCKMWISPRYPFIEALNGLLFVLVFWFEVPFGFHTKLTESCLYTDLGPQTYPGLSWLSPEAFVLIRYAYHMVLIEALVVATFIDFDLRIIPDGSTLPAMFVGIVGSTAFANVHLMPVYFQSPRLLATFGVVTPQWLHPWLDGSPVPAWIAGNPYLHGFVVSLAGLLVGGGIVWLVRILGSWFLQQEAMGFGDVILMAMIGSFLGWQPVIVAFFVAPVCAIAVLVVNALIQGIFWLTGRGFHGESEIPYGPYLSLGTLITLLAWQPLWAKAEPFFNLGILLLPITLMMVSFLALSLMIVRMTKRILGFPPPHLLFDRWTAADQNCFFSGEHVDRHTCRWKTTDWDGCASGQGTSHVERWKSGALPKPAPWRNQ